MVVDPSAQEKTEAFMASVREVGRSQRELVSKHFVLGYLDGVKWDGFVRQFNIEQRQLPRFFILDYAKQSFYEDVEVDEVDEIEHYLIDVAAGKVRALPGAHSSAHDHAAQIVDASSYHSAPPAATGAGPEAGRDAGHEAGLAAAQGLVPVLAGAAAAGAAAPLHVHMPVVLGRREGRRRRC